jgi:1,4-dihydroxy-2-naphthoyl-CoA hydrolase
MTQQLPDTGLTKLLGIKFTELTPEKVVATMPVTSDHHQPFGYLHGGASVVLAETVASVGGYLASQKPAFGLEINANHVKSKKSGTLKATATPLHIGSRTQVWDVKIVDENEALICVSRCTLAVIG